MSTLKKFFICFCAAFMLCIGTPTASFGVAWDPNKLNQLTVDSRGVMRYSGTGGGVITKSTIPPEWQKGGAQYNAKFGGGTGGTPKISTGTTVPKTAKPLEIGRITSKNGNVFTRELFTHTDGNQYYRESFENGQVNYRSAATNKYVSGKGFQNMPPPKTDPIKTNSKLKILKGKAASIGGTALRVAGGLFAIAGGAKMWWDANMGEGARTGKDLLMSTAGGAMVGMGVASLLALSGPAGWIALGAGAAVGAATVLWQMFSETDCLTDPVTNKQTCCNTTTGDVKRKIGDYMFCEKKGGGQIAMVRQCKVGGRSKSSSGILGWAKDLFSDDAWDDNCETRWCSGFSAPPNGLGDTVRYVPDTSKVCWKWDCGESFNYDATTKQCTPKFCDGHGPNEEEKDLPIYTFGLNEEKKCIEWGCIDGYELRADYCAEIIPEPTPENPNPAPAPIDAPQNTPDPGFDPYADIIAKIEAQLAEMDADCGVGGKGNNDDTEILEAIKAANSMGEAIKKLGTNKKFAERAKAAVGKDANSVANENNSSK